MKRRGFIQFQFKTALRRLFTLRENKLIFHFVPRRFELETVLLLAFRKVESFFVGA
jgi:hypothetical protein